MRLFLFFLLILVAGRLSAQSVYPIRTDTLRVYSGAPTGPTLKLESSTAPAYHWYLYTNGTTPSRFGGIFKLMRTLPGNAGTDSFLVKSQVDSTVRTVALPPAAVSSVNGKTGVVEIGIDDVLAVDDTTNRPVFANADSYNGYAFSVNKNSGATATGYSATWAGNTAQRATMAVSSNASSINLNNSTTSTISLAATNTTLSFAGGGNGTLLFGSTTNILDFDNAASNNIDLGTTGLNIRNSSAVVVGKLFNDGRHQGAAAQNANEFVTRQQVTDSLSARDIGLVHIAGTETITGSKTFSNTITSNGLFISNNGTVQSFQGITGGTVGSTGTLSNHHFDFYSNNSMRGRLTSTGRWLLGPSITDDGVTRVQINGNASGNAAIAANHFVTRQQMSDSLAAGLTRAPNISNTNLTMQDNRIITGADKTLNFDDLNVFSVTMNGGTFNMFKDGADVSGRWTDGDDYIDIEKLTGKLSLVGREAIDHNTVNATAVHAFRVGGDSLVSIRQNFTTFKKPILVQGTAEGQPATAANHFITRQQMTDSLGARAAAATNIYTADGTITSATRTLNGNGNRLAFNNLFDFKIDNTHFSGTQYMSYYQGGNTAFLQSGNTTNNSLFEVGAGNDSRKAHFRYDIQSGDNTIFQLHEDGIALYNEDTPNDTMFTVNKTGEIFSKLYKNNVTEDSVLSTDVDGNFKMKKPEMPPIAVLLVDSGTTPTYTPTAADHLVYCNTTAAAITITLPAVTTFGRGKELIIKCIGGNDVTINSPPPGPDIAVPYTLTNGKFLRLVSVPASGGFSVEWIVTGQN